MHAGALRQADGQNRSSRAGPAGSASLSSPRLLAVDHTLSSPGLGCLLRHGAPASVHAEAGQPRLNEVRGCRWGGSCGNPSKPGHPGPLIWGLGH